MVNQLDKLAIAQLNYACRRLHNMDGFLCNDVVNCGFERSPTNSINSRL
jgi:hypothetical protein